MIADVSWQPYQKSSINSDLIWVPRTLRPIWLLVELSNHSFFVGIRPTLHTQALIQGWILKIEAVILLLWKLDYN